MHSVSISMKKQLVTINLKKVNTVAILTFIFPMLIGILLQYFLFKDKFLNISFWDILIILLGYVVLIVAHEGIHAVSFILTGASPKNIKFGILPKKMMAYCSNSKPLTVSAYRFSLLTPLIVTGIIPFILSIIFLNLLYVVLFSSIISAAAGDIMMFIKLLRYPCATMVLDHPKAPAFYLLYDELNLPADFKEVTEEEERALLNEINSK